jgi:hypothetical protein
MAWLAAGVDQQNGNVLMLGLGSGAGAVALLHQFPGLCLTVVDVDVAVIAAARTGWPLLTHYEKEGRLNLVESCAWRFLEETEDVWDMALIDIYRGENFGLHDKKLLELCCEKSAKLWCNHIGTMDSLKVPMQALESAGKPITHLFSADDAPWSGRPENIIFTTATLHVGAVGSFIPFSEYGDHPIAAWALSSYRAVLDTALVPDCA